jgi:hypothetical protein
MKRYSTTILMAVMLATLGAYLYWVELPSERTKTLTEAQEKKLLPFEERDITALTVRSDLNEVVLGAGENRSWRITAPMQTEADAREVESLIRALVLGKVSRVVEEKAASLAPFGLEKPSVVLTVGTGTGQETVSVGDSGPISSTLYAMRASDQKVLLTDLAPKDVLNKTLLTFRKKEILPVDPDKVERLRLTHPPTEVVLYRTDKLWKIRFPIEAEADQTEVRTLLFKLQDLKALGFIDPGPEHAALTKRLTKPETRIALYQAGAEPAVKLFHGQAGSGEAYAVTTPEAPIYRVNPTAIKDLTKDLFALQDKRLLGLNLDEVGTLSVKTREAQYVLINQNGSWVLEDKPGAESVNQQAADLFVSRVVSLPAELRVVKQAGPLAPYGLSSPSAEFTATGKDGKARGRLVLGSRTGGLVYAMGERFPGIYQARADLLTQIPTKPDLLTKPGDAPAPNH